MERRANWSDVAETVDHLLELMDRFAERQISPGGLPDAVVLLKILIRRLSRGLKSLPAEESPINVYADVGMHTIGKVSEITYTHCLLSTACVVLKLVTDEASTIARRLLAIDSVLVDWRRGRPLLRAEVTRNTARIAELQRQERIARGLQHQETARAAQQYRDTQAQRLGGRFVPRIGDQPGLKSPPVTPQQEHSPTKESRKLYDFCRHYREQSPPVKWSSIALAWSRETGETTDAHALRVRFNRTKTAIEGT